MAIAAIMQFNINLKLAYQGSLNCFQDSLPPLFVFRFSFFAFTCYLLPIRFYLLPVTCYLFAVTCYLLPVICSLFRL